MGMQNRQTIELDQLKSIQTQARSLDTQLYQKFKKYNVRKGRVSRLNTIHDMLAYFYPYAYSPKYFNELKKADDPLLTTSANFLTTTYGATLFSQLDLEDNLWRLLPKVPWDRRGWRMVTARHATGGGQAENALLPDTDQAAIGIGSAAPKTIVHTFDASAQAILEGDTADDSYGNPLDAHRPIVDAEHKKDMNGYLTVDTDTLAGDNLESIDRLCISSAASVALGYTANDEDIFGIDRSANAWADAYVDHNSGVDRNFTLSMVDDMIKGVRRYWINSPGAQPVFITGEDTFERWNTELAPQQRFMHQDNKGRYDFGLNGVQPLGELAGGFTIATYRNIPVIVTNDTVADTISRIYLVLTGPNATFMKILAPTQYYEGGWSHGDPFVLNKLGTEGAFVTFAELNSRNLPGNGSIRDLQ